MLRLIFKNYILHLPYSLLLIVQMVIVVFLLNVSFVLLDNENKALNNISFEEDFYVVRVNDNGQRKLEELQKIVGQENVGYMERNGEICVDERDSAESPGVYYLSPLMKRVTYKLSKGTWFTGAENEVILGGAIGAEYKVGDEITISEEGGEEKKATVVGILASPALVLDFSGMDIEDGLYDMFFQQRNVCLTNGVELVSGAGGKIQSSDYLIKISNKKDLEKIQEKYYAVSMQKLFEKSKKQAQKYTAEETMELIVLITIAFVSVAIQIYLYLKKNKKEYMLYRMLGMSRVGIYGMLFCQHLCNMAIAFFFLYLIYDRKGILQMDGVNWYQSMSLGNWFVTILFFVCYMLVTGVVYIFVAPKEDGSKMNGN